MHDNLVSKRGGSFSAGFKLNSWGVLYLGLT